MCQPEALHRCIQDSNRDRQNTCKGLTYLQGAAAVSSLLLESRGEGRATACLFLRTGSQCAGCATADCCTENKNIPVSGESLSRQQAFGHFLCNAAAWQIAALLQNVQPTADRCAILPQPLDGWRSQGVANYALCWQHCLQVDPLFDTVLLSVTKVLASAIPTRAGIALQGCEVAHNLFQSLSA